MNRQAGKPVGFINDGSNPAEKPLLFGCKHIFQSADDIFWLWRAFFLPAVILAAAVSFQTFQIKKIFQSYDKKAPGTAQRAG
jgi:hypothetical protein